MRGKPPRYWKYQGNQPVLTLSSDNSLQQYDNLVVFDGVCNLCTHSVRFILAHEKEPLFRFSPVQSATGNHLISELGLDPNDVETFVVIADGRAYLRSDAAIRIAPHLRGAWRWLGAVKIVPRPLRDWVYDVVARHRYRWFGRTDECMVPAAELRARFIDEK